MKSLVIASCVLLVSAATATAGDVSTATLETMGLAKMTRLADSDGMAIRGKGPYDGRLFNFGPRPGTSFPTFRGPSMNYRPQFPTGGSTFGGTLPGGMGSVDFNSFIGQLGS